MKVLTRADSENKSLHCIEVDTICVDGTDVQATLFGCYSALKLAHFDTVEEAEAAVRDAFLQGSVDFTKYWHKETAEAYDFDKLKENMEVIDTKSQASIVARIMERNV